MASPKIDFAIPNVLQAELDRLRQLNTLDIQSFWQWHSQAVAVTDVSARKTQQWPIAPLNDRQHIAWEKGHQIRWLYHSITVPDHFHGYPLSGLILRLALTWWADDAQIYINGTLVQSGDLFECFTRLCLSSCVKPGETFEVAIRLVSPGHDDGALVRSQLIYELPAQQPTPEPSFIADELTVLATLEPDSQNQIQAALSQLSWDSLAETNPVEDNDDALSIWNNLYDPALPATVHPFQQSLSQLRRTLLPLSASMKQRTIQCVGHAHLDMAWLWPVADTWNAAERTFKSVLNLQKDFPDLTYTHSSPALFEWLEHNRPELFEQIQQKVEEGSWSIDAGLWIEPEFNLISGEAIARHILYGQRYCQEKFGTISKIAWLPDSFGFCWQLPQLLTQGGIETFATLKLSWNDTTQFPHQLFWWQSPDGSRIRALMLPPIGSDIDPVKMSAHTRQWHKSTNLLNTLWLPGLGDHGGGPTKDMLEKATRWEKSPFFPALSFTTPNNFIDTLPLPPSPSLPLWNDELYFELHRGCYTTHADQKLQNRRCEDLLYQAEVFATVAQLTATRPYPKAALDTAWKKLLFNQFHDILPGTAIPEVFTEANRDWKTVREIGNQVLAESIEAIASKIHLPKPPHPAAEPILVFNPLSWSRNSVITLQVPEAEAGALPFGWLIYDAEPKQIPCQTNFTVRAERAYCDVSFHAKNLPAIGYRLFWLCPSDSHPNYPSPEQYILENEFIKATIDPKTGHITSLIEKATQTEMLSAPGNQLKAFQDQGQYWDAWNIDPDYKKHPLATPILQSIQWLETGPIYKRLRTTYKFQESTITHQYSLHIGSPLLKVETHVHWRETQVLLKAHFPLSISSDVATYEMPFGAITRSTNPQTEAEQAQWEVPALRWANLSQTKGNQTLGFSLLTDCKHGFDASPSHLRLTLLKSPIWPDPTADKGYHAFTYAIYPHACTWQAARTVHHARELNIAPIIHEPKAATASQENAAVMNTDSLSTRSFLNILNPNIILSAFKPSEDNPREFIVRCYEAHGEATDLRAENSLGFLELSSGQADWVNILETPNGQEQSNRINPWQISTYRLKKEKLS